MFFPFIGLVVTLSLWSTIFTLQSNDLREDYVRRLTSTIGITAVITGCLDLTNGIISAYGPGKGGDAFTGIYDLVNSGDPHTTATSTVKVPSKTAKSDSSRVAGPTPLSTRAQLLIVVGGALVMASLPRKNTISMDDSTLEEHHAELDQSLLEMSYVLSLEAASSLYEQMDSFSPARFNSIPVVLNMASTKPSQISYSLGSVSQTTPTTSSGASSPTMFESLAHSSSSFTTPDRITLEASPADDNHLPVSQEVMPSCTGNHGFNQCTESNVAFPHEVELLANLDEGKASPRGPTSDTITATPKTTTSQFEQPPTPEQDFTATTPKTRRRPRPSQAKRRHFARQNEQALRSSALGQGVQAN